MNWPWSKKKSLEVTVNVQAETSQPPPANGNWVECRKCGHIVSRVSMRVIERWLFDISYWGLRKKEDLLYCVNCTPPYERIEWRESGERYFKWVEVGKDGKPIKPKGKSQ